ncbi:hypothetical protein [Streptomyces sp. NPDC056244]|uniref:hypothetical protein n=1 Tax=Streptomyces sp. NPDC056244 TaxID=3345762 RepID=UPI0035E2CACA
MNAILNLVATAVTDLTGEGFRSARTRLAGLRTWTDLLASANEDQALLEALILGGLASSRSEQHPFGVVEAFRAEGALLHLRLESVEAVEALLDLLPYAEKRGTRRGVSGMRAYTVGNRLELAASFGDKIGIRWNIADPKVCIHVRRDESLATALQARYDRVVRQGCTPHWVPGESPAPLRRRLPFARDVIFQHRASARLASALLRRPRMWSALVGHEGLVASSTLSEHGLDWTIVRTVARGTALHDERLIQLLQDKITGPDLELLDHVCQEKTCVIRLIGGEGRTEGWRGVLTVRTEHGRSITGRPGRPLATLGEVRLASHPAHQAEAGSRPPRGRCVTLASGPVSGEALNGMTFNVAVRLVTAWATEGHVAAMLTIGERDFSAGLHFARSGTWPKTSVPRPAGDAVHWSRLRLTTGNGQAWSGNLLPGGGIFDVVDDGAVDAALKAACERFSRILVVDQRSFAQSDVFPTRGSESVVFVFGAGKYPRRTTTPKWRRAVDGDRAVDLAPEESAALWRERHLGQHDLSRVPLAGLVLLHKGQEQPLSDAFTEQVEEHLGRYGTPVLGWLPPEPTEDGLLYRGATRTVLDDMSEEKRGREIAVASAIGRELW